MVKDYDWDQRCKKETVAGTTQYPRTEENGAVQDNAKRKIIPCHLSSTTEYNDYCPTPLGGDEGHEILDKIEEISKGL